MTKAIIIDDEPLARGLVREYLQEHPFIHIAAECGDGFEGLKAIQEHRPDLLFLDVQMPKINGFEMLELLDPPPAVIFTTAFDEYAIRAFDRHAVDYLLKPFSKERFAKAIERWKERAGQKAEHTTVSSLLDNAAESPQQKERIVVKSGSSIIVIPVEEIVYLEAADKYVRIVTHDAHGPDKLIRTPLREILPRLDPGLFWQIHSSHVVNLRAIERISRQDHRTRLHLRHRPETLEVSRLYAHRFKAM